MADRKRRAPRRLVEAGLQDATSARRPAYPRRGAAGRAPELDARIDGLRLRTAGTKRARLRVTSDARAFIWLHAWLRSSGERTRRFGQEPFARGFERDSRGIPRHTAVGIALPETSHAIVARNGTQPADARLRRLRSRRRRRRAGRHRGGDRRGALGTVDDLHRALRLLRRRRHGRGLEHVLRAARRHPRQARAGRPRHRRRHSRAARAHGRAEQAALDDSEPDPRAGVRHLRVQDRGRRAARRSERARAVPRIRHGRRHGERRPHRSGARRDEVRALRDPRPNLHRRLRRRRSRRLGRRAVRSRRRRRQHAVSVDDVPHQRRRSRESGPRLGARAEAHGGSRATRPHLPAQETDRSAAAQSDRVARQSHADQEPERHGRQRHRRARAFVRRGRRPQAVLGRVPVHQGNARRASSRPTSSRSRRRSASARRGACAASTC